MEPAPASLRAARRVLAAVAAGYLVTACSAAASAPSGAAASGFPGPRPTAPPPWTSLTPRPIVTAPLSGVGGQYVMAVTAYRDGFVAVGDDVRSDSDVDAAIWVTPDGTSWQRLATSDNDLAGAVLDLVATDGTKLVAVGHGRTGPGGDARDGLVWVSDDAEHWRKQPRDAAIADTEGIAGVAGGANGLVAWAYAETGAIMLHSADGTSWERSPSPASFAEASVRDVRPYRRGFVAVGAHVPPRPKGQASIGGPDDTTALGWWSADGLTWTSARVDAGPGLDGVEVAADGLLGLGRSGCGGCISPTQLWASADGQAWRRLGSDLDSWPAYGSEGGRIVRFDWQGTGDVASSIDGTSWTRIGHLERPDLYAFTVGSHGLLISESIPKGAIPEDVDGGMWFISANP